MTKYQANDFLDSAHIAIKDIQLQTAIGRATINANHGREVAFNELENPELLRQQGRNARLRGLYDLPELLEQVEQKVVDAGGTVLWAVDGEEANRHVRDICEKHQLKRGVKVKSMVTEEIDLVPMLEKHGIEMLETDLGEYIVQIAEDSPSHIVMPVMHMTKEKVRETFMERLDMPYVETPEEMTAFAREQLRMKYLQADFGMSGGNFIIAETGHVINVTNEGNGRLCTGIPPVHIAVVGIEKVIPTWEDFITLLQLLTRASTGQRLSVYMNALSGPSHADDGDGAEHFYLILLDNGRTDIYAGEYAEALACVRCGACLNICPVYRSVGGHAYGAVYPGPIGSVLTPLLKGKENAAFLPFASSLCGACKDVCPVDINLPHMLLSLRRDLESKQSIVWKTAMKGFGVGFGHPLFYGVTSKAAQTFLSREPQETETGEISDEKPMIHGLPFPVNGWTDYRDFPAFAKGRFRDWWKKNR
jgi:L-lactate dehydrogenase complex protein LldF